MIDAAILRYCKYQERCHSEVSNKLGEIGIYGADREIQIALLIEEGVLNEERFARSFARGRFRLKHWGRVKIKQHLKLKRVSDYCIKKAMTEIDPEEYEQTIVKAGARKMHELRTEKNPLARKVKVTRYLLQKGYEQDLINDLLTEIEVAAAEK
jgi:regulatory protein